MSISDWPEDQRPREKLLKRGPASLSDAELLAIFLRTGMVGKNAVQLGQELLTRFDGIAGLFGTPPEALGKIRALARPSSPSTPITQAASSLSTTGPLRSWRFRSPA